MAQFDEYTDCEGKSHSIGEWGRLEDWEKDTSGDSSECSMKKCKNIHSWEHVDWGKRKKVGPHGYRSWLCDTHFQEVFGEGDCFSRAMHCHFEGDSCSRCGKSSTAEKDNTPSVKGKLKPGFKTCDSVTSLYCSECGNFTHPGSLYWHPEKRGDVYCQSCASYQESDFEDREDTTPAMDGRREKCYAQKYGLGENHYTYSPFYYPKDDPNGDYYTARLCQKHYQELIGEDGVLTEKIFDEQLKAMWDVGGQPDIPVRIPTNPKKGVIMSVVEKVKQLAKSKDDRLLEKYGVTDECGDLTNEGHRLVAEKAFTDYKAAIVEDLKKLDAEEKKK